MPRKQTKNLSNVNGMVFVPVVPIDQVTLIGGHEAFTVSLEFVGATEAHWRCRIGRWHGPWRTARGEAMRDLHDNIRLRMNGRLWTRGQDYEVRALSGALGAQEVQQTSTHRSPGIGGRP